MTKSLATWKAELRLHRKWWVALALALVGGILAVHFGFAGNYGVMAIFASMFIVGLWIKPQR